MFDEIRPHLLELRKRLAISVLSVFILFFVAFSYYEPLLAWVSAPLHDALAQAAKTSHNASEGMVTTTQLGGTFFVAMKVSFFAALLGSMPIILSQLWLFIAPGLYAHEKKILIPFVVGGTTMFALGVAFAYYVVTPFGFGYLIAFGSASFIPMINIEDYIDFFTKVMLGFGLAFELPIFCYFLALLKLITDQTMIGFFRYAIVLIFIVAAVLTPPDVVSQVLMALPLVFLYGISIIIVHLVNPAPKEPKDA